MNMASFATSYIPTVATTITRAADSASMTGTNFSSWYNQAQGSFNVIGDYNNYMVRSGFFNLGNISCYTVNRSSSDTIAYGSLNTYDNYVVSYAIVNPNTLLSTALAYINSGVNPKIGNLRAATNGLYYPLSETAPTYLLVSNNIFYIGTGLGQYLNGHIRKLSYYPVALSSSNLVALTS